jgi:hypothetical protein
VERHYDEAQVDAQEEDDKLPRIPAKAPRPPICSGTDARSL